MLVPHKCKKRYSRKDILKFCMKTECEILIIRGGQAGSTLAKELSKNSIDNILIQRNLTFKKPCGGGLRSVLKRRESLLIYKTTLLPLLNVARKSFSIITLL
jgi:heterodisulfide reductase subunit A-like polyferredoxin